MPQTAEKSPWLTEGDEKRSAVRDMFAQIAPSYDRVNSLMSLRLHYRWRALAVKTLNLRPGDQVLDLCCGTGDFFSPLRQSIGKSGTIVGLDFCRPMLERAHQKYAEEGELIEADACSLPLAENLFDGVTVGWGLRNVPDVPAALHEAWRVLKAGKRFVSLDMARPRGPFGTISEKVFHAVVPAVGKLFGHTTAYQYLPQSTLKFASREELVSLLTQAGFINVQYRDLFFGNICMHWGEKP